MSTRVSYLQGIAGKQSARLGDELMLQNEAVARLAKRPVLVARHLVEALRGLGGAHDALALA